MEAKGMKNEGVNTGTNMVRINSCTFQNRTTKRFKWLSLECLSGTNRYCLYESKSDSAEEPSKRPSDCEVKCPASYADYESAKARIPGEGYDIRFCR
jgi:hypothetical protein